MTRSRTLKRKITIPDPVQLPVPAPQQPGAVQINGQTYYPAQMAIQPYQGDFQPVQTPYYGYLAEQQPQYIQPRPIGNRDPLRDWRLWAFVGGCFFVAGVFGYAIVKSAIPAPVATPAPAPAPVAPIIINQAPPAPHPPLPQPFTERECRPGGFLGMAEICTTRQGYR